MDWPGGVTDDTLERHIEECPECQAKLERLAQNDAGAAPATPSLPCPENPPRIPGFVIRGELGRGSTSVVYEELQPSLNRRVALKVVRSGPAAGSHEHIRWLREARSFSRVRHDHVVRLYQVGAAGGWLYLVLELVPGGTIKDRLNVPYAPKGAAQSLGTIARAVAAIHGAGLLHLDLKPSNILLDAAPEAPQGLATPRVADFGLACRWDNPHDSASATALAAPLGTPSYMAPEQVAGDRAAIGPAADIHGLGALLYHLLTGRPPFVAPSVAETLEQVRHQEPMPPRRLNPAIPRDLETICLTRLEKDPHRRYHSAEALADDLRRWLDHHPIAARPLSFLEKTGRWCRRRPVVAALAAILALTLSASFLIVLLLWRHAESERNRARLERSHAELERNHAEADYQVARATLAEILNLGARGVHSAVVLTRDELIRSLQGARSRIFELARTRTSDPTIWDLLALVDLLLDRNLDIQGKLAEALPLHAESLMYWEKILEANGLDQMRCIADGRP
jgi:serine/threonine protein kinase